MKVFFDTEFTGLFKQAALISIGFISEDGRTFYAEFNDFDQDQLNKNEWLKENVLPGMRFTQEYASNPALDEEHHAMKADKRTVASQIYSWLMQFSENPDMDKVELWSDCLAYDWVLFCDLWGGALNIPPFVYYIPFDLSTLFKIKDVDPDVTRETFADMNANHKHNSLWDAKVIRACYMKLTTDDIYVKD